MSISSNFKFSPQKPYICYLISHGGQMTSHLILNYLIVLLQFE